MNHEHCYHSMGDTNVFGFTTDIWVCCDSICGDVRIKAVSKLDDKRDGVDFDILSSGPERKVGF